MLINTIPASNEPVTVPFRFKGRSHCDAIAIMGPGFHFTKEILDCVENIFNVKAFDACAIPSVAKGLQNESKTILETLAIANEKHKIKQVFLFQTVDVHENGKSTRFKDQASEDVFHISGLLKSREIILEKYPKIKVTMVYVTLSKNQNFIRMYQIYPDGEREIISRPVYRCKGVNVCDTALVRCIEFRTRKEDRAYVRFSLGIDTFGLIGLQGASKEFLADSEIAWKAIALACNSEGCKRIILIHHADCGAYGGQARFKGDAEAEEAMHRQEMYKMRAMLYEKHPGVEVILVYVRLINDQTQLQYVRFE